MTHDKLLTKLNPVITVANITKQYHALRAVVELHKPRNTSMGIVCCELCSGGKRIFKAYPCPTIQTIEKELA